MLNRKRQGLLFQPLVSHLFPRGKNGCSHSPGGLSRPCSVPLAENWKEGEGPCFGLCSRPISPPPHHPAPHSQAYSPSLGARFCPLPLLPPSDVAFPSLRNTCFLHQDQNVEEEEVGPAVSSYLASEQCSPAML